MKFRKDDLVGLWSLLWRVALFGTLLFPVGMALLIVLLGLLIVPPIYAVVCLIDGRFLIGMGVGLAWLILLRIFRRFRCGLLEGVEHGSL